MSPRRACSVVGVHRSSIHYKAKRGDVGALRARLKALAHERRRFGYRRLRVLLRRQGCTANKKREQRLYREESSSCAVAAGANARSGYDRRRPASRLQGGYSVVATLSHSSAFARFVKMECALSGDRGGNDGDLLPQCRRWFDR